MKAFFSLITQIIQLPWKQLSLQHNIHCSKRGCLR